MRSRLDRSEVKMLAICYLEEGAKALRQGYVGEQQGWGEQRGEQ